MTVMVNGYAYLVQYVRDGENYFLKTIILSIKATMNIKGINNV
jgi:hypothetical protein